MTCEGEAGRGSRLPLSLVDPKGGRGPMHVPVPPTPDPPTSPDETTPDPVPDDDRRLARGRLSGFAA